MSDALIVAGCLGTICILVLCCSIGYLGFQLSRVTESTLRHSHKEDRDHRQLLERFLELMKAPSHLTHDVSLVHAQERTNQVVVETKADYRVLKDPVPESQSAPPMVSTDPDGYKGVYQ